MSGPGAPSECRGPARLLSVGARRSLRCIWKVPAVCVSGSQSVSGPGGPLPALFVSGPGGSLPRSFCQGPALCVGARRFVPGPGAPPECQGPALFVLAPSALCRGPALLLSVVARRFSPRLFLSGPGALCVGARRSLCRGPRSVSGPGALCVGARRSCVGARRSLGRGSALSGVGVEARCSSAKTLCLEGPGDLCVRSRCFLSRSPGALCRGSVSGPGAPCGALCRSPAVHSQAFIFQSVLGLALTVCHAGPGALCVGARRPF